MKNLHVTESYQKQVLRFAQDDRANWFFNNLLTGRFFASLRMTAGIPALLG
jgi:hypothetical protein